MTPYPFFLEKVFRNCHFINHCFSLGLLGRNPNTHWNKNLQLLFFLIFTCVIIKANIFLVVLWFQFLPRHDKFFFCVSCSPCGRNRDIQAHTTPLSSQKTCAIQMQKLDSDSKLLPIIYDEHRCRAYRKMTLFSMGIYWTLDLLGYVYARCNCILSSRAHNG